MYREHSSAVIAVYMDGAVLKWNSRSGSEQVTASAARFDRGRGHVYVFGSELPFSVLASFTWTTDDSSIEREPRNAYVRPSVERHQRPTIISLGARPEPLSNPPTHYDDSVISLPRWRCSELFPSRTRVPPLVRNSMYIAINPPATSALHDPPIALWMLYQIIAQ